MANIKSAKKRISVIAKKTMINRIRKSQIKTAIKRFEAALAEGNIEAATKNFRYAQKKIQQIASKGTIHKNAASRKVSKLASKLNAASSN
ncbi:MAG: 30S ribosomal protein S20 [Peptostreptococcaceae bacterium]|nr:30S ribosomal protein S20 [Peptostreptococcaceae bacterium]